jgi:hypothetical protein
MEISILLTIRSTANSILHFKPNPPSPPNSSAALCSAVYESSGIHKITHHSRSVWIVAYVDILWAILRLCQYPTT